MSSKSFAMLFVVLMALPALPLRTGAVSHVLESVIAAAGLGIGVTGVLLVVGLGRALAGLF